MHVRMRGAERSGRCVGFPVGEHALHVSGDLLGLVQDERGLRRRHDFVGGLGEEAEPAVEVALFDRELEVREQRVPLVLRGGKKDRGPELLEEFEVCVPVVDGVLEDGADLVVLADLGIEAVDESGDLFFGGELFRVHSDSFSEDVAWVLPAASTSRAESTCASMACGRPALMETTSPACNSQRTGPSWKVTWPWLA